MATKHRTYRTLTNAKTWDGSLLSGGESIRLINGTEVSDYVNVQDSRTALEPFTFRPDTNPGTNSWHLVGTSARIGALIKLTSNYSLTTGIVTTVDWDAAEYDDADFWEGVTNPDRLTIPIGVNKVKIKISGRFSSNSTGTRFIYQEKNASAFDGRGYLGSNALSAGATNIQATSAIVDAVAGNYFTGIYYQASGGALDLETNENTWLSLEAVGFA